MSAPPQDAKQEGGEPAAAGEVVFKKRKRKANRRTGTITADDGGPEKKQRVEDGDAAAAAAEAAGAGDEQGWEADEAAYRDRDDQIEQAEPREGEEETVVWRKPKRQAKNNPMVQATRRREKTVLEHDTHTSKRTVMPDQSTQDHMVAVDVVAEKADRPKQKWVGPVKPLGANVRAISRFDYQPDLCKDYKETGYCGFGDSCKFVHDRGDYKSGWQLEKEWEEEQKQKLAVALGGAAAEEEDFRIREEDEMPFACLLCRGDFVNPVATRCGHYFCEQCALHRYTKDKKCAACGIATNGIFNTAHKLIAVLKRRKELEERLGGGAEAGGAKEEAEEEGGELAPAVPGIVGQRSDSAAAGTGSKYQADQGWAIP